MTQNGGEAGAYAGIRERVTALLADVDDERARATVVPTCPGWAVPDVAAHLAGVCDDILNGRLDGVATDPWTAAQVEARRDRPLAEVVDEWNRLGPQVEALVPNFGSAAGQLVLDAVSHEHDLRTALDRPGARDSDAVAVAFEWLLDDVRFPAGAGSLRLEFEDGTSRTIGEGEPHPTLTLDRFTALRSFTGRRTLEQIRALEWTGDPTPWLPTSKQFPPPAETAES